MVLSGVNYFLSPTDLFKGPVSDFVKIEDFKTITFQTIFVKVCKACQEEMASIPPSAFTAGRIRETQRDMKVSNIKKAVESPKYYHTKYNLKNSKLEVLYMDANLIMELTPLKYNSKLMNSIWGFYNRYSPHNVKKNNDAITLNSELQQSASNSTNKNETTITLPSAKLDNVWASFNASQSH